MFDINTVLAKNDLLQVAERAGARFHHTGGEYRSFCPLHGGNNPTGFAVYTRDGKQQWTCFSGDCGTGDVIDFVMRHHRCDFVRACEILGGDSKPDPESVRQAAVERAERAARNLEEQIRRAQDALTDLRSAQAWVAYHDELEGNENARRLWRERGVPDDWQNYWQLGYSAGFPVATKDGRWITPTLTIPIFGAGWEVLTIRHRLLNPPTPNDKYRPERPGLSAHPFLGDPDRGLDHHRILVVEGEIKGMVAYLTLDDPDIQVIGIPGKSWFPHIADQLKGHDVTICFDPDADQEALGAAKSVGGKVVRIAMKVDDAINAGAIDQKLLMSLLAWARKNTNG